MSRVLLVAGGNPSDWPTIEPATYDYFVGIDRGCLHLLEADLPLQLAVGDFDSLSRRIPFCPRNYRNTHSSTC